jgi:hypothetical protein
MQAGVHAVGWGLQRLAIVVVGLAATILFAYVVLVTVLVASQAVAAFGQ